jgi:hypothetical protein
MHIFISVRMPVVPAVMGGPPQGTALSGTTGNEGSDELKYPRGLECPVRKITMVKCGN